MCSNRAVDNYTDDNHPEGPPLGKGKILSKNARSANTGAYLCTPGGRFKTDAVYLSAVTSATLTTRRSIFLAAASFFDIFQALPVSFVLHPLRFPFSPSLSLARGKSQLRKSFLAFFRNAINDARFPFGWMSGGRRRGLDCRAYFFAVSFS